MGSQNVRKFTCWAAACGGCGEGPSREHLISDCLFPERSVRVSGFDWCEGKDRSIGIDGLARQILCKTHNSALSETDAEAKRAVGLFQRSSPSTSNSQGESGSSIDGRKLERWLLKTAINMSYGGKLHIGVDMAGSMPGLPSPYLIDVAFGRIAFSHLMGAHFLFPTSETLLNPGEIMVFPLIKGDQIGGFFFDLRSQPIFLNLFPGHAPASIGAVTEKLGLPRALLDAQLIWRPPNVAVAVNGSPVGTIGLNW